MCVKKRRKKRGFQNDFKNAPFCQMAWFGWHSFVLYTFKVYSICELGIVWCGMGTGRLSPTTSRVTIFRALQLCLTPGTFGAKSDAFYLPAARTGLAIGEVEVKVKRRKSSPSPKQSQATIKQTFSSH